MSMNMPRAGYVYDSNNMTLTALQLLKSTITNPAGSGKKIIIEGYAIPNAGTVGGTASFHHMPTGGLPAGSAIKPVPYLMDTNIDSPANTAVFKAGVSLIASGGFTGGTPILTVPIKPQDRNYIEGAPLTLLPGVTLGFILSPGVIMTNIAFVIYTREEDIT